MEPIRIGVLGLGTVGAGTVNVLRRNAGEIARRAGRGIDVTRAAVREPGRRRDCDLAGIDLTGDAGAVVDDPSIDVIVELIGGTGAARDLVMRAIGQGKHVVTANKALIALHGNEIFTAARAAGAIIAFEASVAGAIPVIKSLREGLAGNRIRSLAGIINGTSNFILTAMQSGGQPFDEVLAEAQALGYAEADPTFDIEGIDAAHKLTILASIAFGHPLQFDRVHVEGLGAVEPVDISYADQLGYRIKHLGLARRTDRGIEMRVHPTMVPKQRLLASVDGVMNAVLIEGDAAGPIVCHGAGAGAEPTASSVVADLVDVVRTLTTDPDQRVPHLAFQPDRITDLPVLAMEEVESAYYLRMLAEDRPGVLAELASILGGLDISIEAVVQREPPRGVSQVHLIMLTHRVQESRMNTAVAGIEASSCVEGPVTRIRVEHFEAD